MLTLIGAISIAGSGANAVISCSNSKKFDKNNFSTWGTKQKKIIKNAYIKYINDHSSFFNQSTTWDDWSVEGGGGTVKSEGEIILDILDQFGGDYSGSNYDYHYTYSHTPKTNLRDKVFSSIENGFNLNIQAKPNFILKGKTSVYIKGELA